MGTIIAAAALYLSSSLFAIVKEEAVASCVSLYDANYGRRGGKGPLNVNSKNNFLAVD